MHVSSKIAFHLADSFYLGIRQADVVALETNPESWQEDMSKYDVEYNSSSGLSGNWGNFLSIPDDYLNISTLRFYHYDKKIEQALYSTPSAINNLLYRSFGNESSDFEEDTYLDMYIYQCGKKWGKKVAGVEKYGESMKLMAEAYHDAILDNDQKDRSFDGDNNYSPDKIQEAYRAGNLDLLDSINRFNSFSAAFDEKFLYRRNEIQANSIDSILKSNSSLFVGVGAAHLPGNRGVIELLRKKGYNLRPVKMDTRDSKDNEQVEKVRVPVTFNTQVAEDSSFRVDIPGKFYKVNEGGSLDQRQYADMANGSYYMVTRIMTNAWMLGNSEEDVYRIVDSLLYENIPGKILSKKTIFKNGYKGFDITNRTRRGDLQRYNIFITPFEIIFFKMSGTGNYVEEGDEAKRFFGSIQLKEYKNNSDPYSGWRTYSPTYGGFSVSLPESPYIGNDGSWIFDAEDKNSNSQYRVIRTDIHNYHFVEEDTFDLGLMDESFSSSEFIAKETSRKQITHKGYPALDCKYKDKNGSIYLVRFIIQGPHYYLLIAHGKQESTAMQKFLNSFEIKPYIYEKTIERKDTSLYYTVMSPVFPVRKKEKIEMTGYNYLGIGNDDNESDGDGLNGGIYRNKVISNDSTGEKIYVSFSKSPVYEYEEDSSWLNRDDKISFWADTGWIVKSKKRYELPGNMRVREMVVTDTGSSRTIWVKTFYKKGIGFSLMTESDTLSEPGGFVKKFFESFSPNDSLKGVDPFTRKDAVFFDDFFSKDSIAHRRAVNGIDVIKLDSSDLSQLQKAINSLGWSEKKYLDTKRSLIRKLDDIKTPAASDFLKTIYFASGDTIELQYVALETLLQQQTAYAFRVFKDIVTTDPPVLDLNVSGREQWMNRISSLNYSNLSDIVGGKSSDFDNGSFLDELYDSLALTKTILPDLLPLLNIDDYKVPVMALLGEMVDSGWVKPEEYSIYFTKFFIEAKQELKKQAINEKKKEIEKAEKDKKPKSILGLYGTDENENDNDNDNGNQDLSLYATLLMPFWEKNAGVQPLVQQVLHSNDKRLRYNTLLLLIRNNKPYPDTLIKYFASLDDYRYELYRDLKKINKLILFPVAYNNHLDLAKSFLVFGKPYDKPDSIVYLDRLPASVKNKSGYVYFFKYKQKKDDIGWKLASVGLVPKDESNFEVLDNNDIKSKNLSSLLAGFRLSDKEDFTDFSSTRITDEEPLKNQLIKQLKKMLYSLHKSAKQFYHDGDDSDDEDGSITPSMKFGD